jgi:hypothetical protein
MLQAGRQGKPKVDPCWLAEARSKSTVADQWRRVDDFTRGQDEEPCRCTILGRIGCVSVVMYGAEEIKNNWCYGGGRTNAQLAGGLVSMVCLVLLGRR